MIVFDSMAHQSFLIRFDGISMSEANVMAESLRDELLNADPEIRAETRRDSTDTMDFGGTLILILGTPAVTMAARAILKWAARNNAASIRLERPDGSLVATNLESKDVASIVKSFGASNPV
jgi:hypothetical protein